MMRIHILQHESFEAPGAIETWAKRGKHPVTYTRFFQMDALPRTLDDLDFLIIMGGPQSPATTLKECPHFDAAAEIAFIKKAINGKKKVLGVCLGAQLIGEAFGAKFEHSPNREIGVFDVSLTDDAKSDPVFSRFPKTFPVGHWHGDMPGLTPESKVLAKSEGCPRQVVRYTPDVYGFQCHFEFTSEAVEGMIKNAGHELQEFRSLPFIQTEAEIRNQDYRGMNRLLFSFLEDMESRRT